MAESRPWFGRVLPWTSSAAAATGPQPGRTYNTVTYNRLEYVIEWFSRPAAARAGVEQGYHLWRTYEDGTWGRTQGGYLGPDPRTARRLAEVAIICPGPQHALLGQPPTLHSILNDGGPTVDLQVAGRLTSVTLYPEDPQPAIGLHQDGPRGSVAYGELLAQVHARIELAGPLESTEVRVRWAGHLYGAEQTGLWRDTWEAAYLDVCGMLATQPARTEPASA